MKPRSALHKKYLYMKSSRSLTAIIVLTVLYRTYCIVLTVLHSTVLYCTGLYGSALHSVAIIIIQCCTILQHIM